MSQPAVVQPQGSGGGGVLVRCAGCKVILTVAPSVTEFVCPTCQVPQMLPPELIKVQFKTAASAATTTPPPRPSSQPLQQQHVPAHGIDPTKMQVPCAHCKAILNVPHGLARFTCPQCNADLAVDLSKLKKQFFQPRPRPPPPPPEEINEDCSSGDHSDEAPPPSRFQGKEPVFPSWTVPVFTKDGAIKEVPVPRKKNVMGYPLALGTRQITNAEAQDLIWMVGNLKLEVTRYSRLLYKGSDQSVDDTRDANSSGSITARRVSKRMRRPSY
nr:protein FORGETTER 1-like [Quercus suber]POE98426.1 protein forgetter 1 [Quercus suber]